MASKQLLEARGFEKTFGEQIEAKDRPSFHLSPWVGWMNDPNGFSWYQGKCHLFYQYNPYHSKWDTMHWGHAVTTDFLHWDYLPAALAPDEIYDQNGCFSGSAIETDAGKHLLIYTGVRLETTKSGKRVEVQTQNLAIGDGVDYEKYEGNPVLDERDVPSGGSRIDFRDPKIWRGRDGLYYCVIGNRPEDGSGQILLYRSEDAFRWEFWKTLVENKNRFGKMWECPDFFELDGKWVLLTSPQDMLPFEFEYHNGNGTLCLIGDFDETSGSYTEQSNQAIDYGIDFYAPQTILTPDGRRIMIGWMQNWDACAIREPEAPWATQMSLPRELSVRDGRLYQKPVREIEALRQEKVEYENIAIEGEKRLDGICGRTVDMELFIEPLDSADIYHVFEIRFAENASFHTSLSFRPRESVLKIDRKFSGSRRAIIHQRRTLVPDTGDGKIRLRIILDRFSAEVFVNDGYQVMSVAIYTEVSADGISFFADGGARISITKYALK